MIHFDKHHQCKIKVSDISFFIVLGSKTKEKVARQGDFLETYVLHFRLWSQKELCNKISRLRSQLILNISNSFMLVWPLPVSGQHCSPFPVSTPVAGGHPLQAGTGIPFVRVWAHRCLGVSSHRVLEVLGCLPGGLGVSSG